MVNQNYLPLIFTTIFVSSLIKDSTASSIIDQEQLILNASLALHKAGYHTMATSLQIAGDQILPNSPSTFFALHDHSLINITLPPWLMFDLLHYHTCPEFLDSETLASENRGTCIPTLLQGKNLVITSNPSVAENPPSINGVPIVNPNIYSVPHRLVIHGVHAPFHSFKQGFLETGLDDLVVAPCSSPRASQFHGIVGMKQPISWFQVHSILRFKGFISFSNAVKLQEQELEKKQGNLSQVTIFAPVDQGFAYVSSPSPVLWNLVRFHVVPRRLHAEDLVRLGLGSMMPTLLQGEFLVITRTFDGQRPLMINNVSVVWPEIFTSKQTIVHGITQTLVPSVLHRDELL